MPPDILVKITFVYPCLDLRGVSTSIGVSSDYYHTCFVDY